MMGEMMSGLPCSYKVQPVKLYDPWVFLENGEFRIDSARIPGQAGDVEELSMDVHPPALGVGRLPGRFHKVFKLLLEAHAELVRLTPAAVKPDEEFKSS